LRNGYSIQHERHEVLGATTRLYLSGDASSYVDVPTDEVQSIVADEAPVVALSATLPAAEPIASIVSRYSSAQHLDPDLVASVIHAESDFNAKAVSRKGAQGLMQLMPDTASRLGVSDSFDASANVEGGTRYLRTLLERYHFDMVKALAAYNAGPERVEKYHGVPPYYETQAYVARIVTEFNRKKMAERKALNR
jgi:soluble lytic murein transglycosylase-like protein